MLDVDRILSKATALKAARYEIVVRPISGSRAHKEVRAMRGHFDTVLIWEGAATGGEMKRLVQELKMAELIDPKTTEIWSSTRSSTGYYVPLTFPPNPFS